SNINNWKPPAPPADATARFPSRRPVASDVGKCDHSNWSGSHGLTPGNDPAPTILVAHLSSRTAPTGLLHCTEVPCSKDDHRRSHDERIPQRVSRAAESEHPGGVNSQKPPTEINPSSPGPETTRHAI